MGNTIVNENYRGLIALKNKNDIRAYRQGTDIANSTGYVMEIATADFKYVIACWLN